MYFETILAVLFMLGLLVYVHELGHFTAAKLFGVRVDEFAFGFWKRLIVLGKRNGTIYAINLIPLGGYVKIAGMEPGEESGPDGFNSQTLFRRAIIIFAGPFMSLVLACVIFWLIGATWGYQTGPSKNVVSFVQPGSPAAKMGLLRGDKILEVNGIKVSNGEQVRNAINKSGGEKLSLIVSRNSKDRVVLSGKPMEVIDPQTKKKRYQIGIILEAKLERTSLVKSFKQGSYMAWGITRELVITLTSKRIKTDVGGPISIVKAAHSDVQVGWYWVVIRLGALSLTLAIINLLPIPILDGGHLMLLLIEKIRGRRLSREQTEIITAVGLAVIVALFALIMYADISRLINNTPIQ